MPSFARRFAITAAALAGLTLVGATVHPFERLARSDRLAAAPACEPAPCPAAAAAEVIDVAPGLTVVGRPL